MKFGFGDEGCSPHPRDIEKRGLEHELAGLHPSEIKRRVRYGISDVSQVKLINRETGKTITIKEFEEECKMPSGYNGNLYKSILVKFVGGYSRDKKYVFNLRTINRELLNTVKVGTILSVKNYTADMVVTDILDHTFSYVNKANGDMKSGHTNTNDMKIVEIDLDRLTQIVSFVEV